MNRMVLFFALWFAIPASAAAPATAPAINPARGVKAEVVQISIQRPLTDTERDVVIGGVEGTTLTLVLSGFDQFIVGLDETKCRLTTFTDDMNMNLNKAESFGLRPAWLGPFGAHVSHDGHACSVQIVTPAIPAAGANHIALNAELSFTVGSAQQTVEKNLLLKMDEQITAGPVQLRITAVENDVGGENQLITFSSDKPINSIRGITFISVEGAEIKAHAVAHTELGTGKHSTYNVQYALPTKADRLTARVSYFEKLETIATPVNVRVGIGL